MKIAKESFLPPVGLAPVPDGASGMQSHCCRYPDKPMIYYPLAALLRAVSAIFSSSSRRKAFYRLLGSGGRFSVNITYECRRLHAASPDALLIGSQFIRMTRLPCSGR